MNLRSAIVGQFTRPTGGLGALAGWVMANRPSNIARNRWTIDLLGVEENDVVLEIGCGPGIALSYAASIARKGQILGIDYSEVMVRQASRRLRREMEHGRVSIRCMSVNDVPSLAMTFDKIYSANVAQFFADPVAVFQILRTCLRPGGLIATTYQPRSKGAGPADAARAADKFAAVLLAAGFTDIRRETLELKPVPAVCLLGKQPS